MTTRDNTHRPGRAASTRRQFLIGGAAAGLGAAAALGADRAFARERKTPVGQPLNGSATVAFYGTHQAGIATDAQAHATFIGLDLRAELGGDNLGRADLARLMRLLTDDAARLTQGDPPLADSEPELGVAPARLTVTFGFGPGFVARAEGVSPSWLEPLPAFGIDDLQSAFCDGDLLIQVASDDPVTVAHSTRMLLKDARSFATIRWIQHGFRRAHGSVKPRTTMRNLFGQVDGTSNPEPGTADFDEVVWATNGWFAGGTGAVIRRIRMDLEEWDRLDRAGRDQALGRFQSNGAPLTSSPEGTAAEFDEPDFDAKNAVGFPIIPGFSHVARARPVAAHERIFRRAYNYQGAPIGDELSDSGLIFASFQADVARQFVPIQRRLDELDLLNEWTTPIGSSVFVLPPGCEKGGFIGETLLG